MLAKRRLFGALLFMLTLLSSAACAKLNLKPYEVPSASGTEVEILAPEVYLLLHDSPLNGGKLKTALVLLDHGQTVFEQRLPDHTADSENLSYRLFVADANRYGILTTGSHSNFIRFRLLEDGALSEGFSVQGDLTGYAALLGWLCNLSWEGGAYAVNRFDWNGILLASTPVSPLHAATYGGFTVLADKSVAYIALDIDISQGRYALNHLRVSAGRRTAFRRPYFSAVRQLHHIRRVFARRRHALLYGIPRADGALAILSRPFGCGRPPAFHQNAQGGGYQRPRQLRPFA